MNTSMIRSRIDPETKALADKIFDHMGLTMSQAIRLFLRQTISEQGLPFQVRVPNEVTLKTFKDTDANRNLVYCENADDMFKKLGIEEE
jgi:DNA-damage-inducible protein J